MENNSDFELIVSQGRRPIWNTFLAGGFFTLLIYYVYLLFQVLWKLGFCQMFLLSLPAFIKMIGLTLAGGISFSITKTVLIDVDQNKLISRYFVGPFSKDVLSVVPNLEYVSVFLDSKEIYQLNLWYNTNKHYKMYDFDEKESAMKYALEIATKLKIQLLDATEKGNFKWIETNS